MITSKISTIRNVSLAIGVVACVGCTELNYAGAHYGDMSPVNFEYGGKTWRIFDKPADGRLMITPSIGDSAAAGAVEALTFGIAGNASGPEGAFHAAAAAFVAQRSSSCQILNGALIIKPQWEFFYRC